MRPTYLLFAAITALRSVCFALSVQLVPTLPPLITNVDLSHYDITGTGVTQQMFVLRIDNSGDTAHTGLRLRYQVFFEAGGETQKLYEGLSELFDMAAGEVVEIRSNDFLKKNNTAVRTSIRSTLYELSDIEFKRRVLDSQRLPDGQIRYVMTLEWGGTPIGQDEFTCSVLNTTRIDLVAPGAPASGTLPAVAESRPVFIWTSDLRANMYQGMGGSEDVFEVRVYKARSGETMAQATSRAPILRERTSLLQLPYPSTAEPLLPGVTYYWEVSGFLRGLTTSEIKSRIFGFSIIQPVDARVHEILGILRLIYDEETLKKVYDYSADATVRIDGRAVDVNELRELVNKILSEEYEIQSTTVY